MTSFDYAARLERARSEMAANDLDVLLLSTGTDLPYLTGYEAMPLERLTMLVLTSSDAVLVVPQLEAPRVAPGPFEVRAWQETEDPIEIVAGMVGTAGSVAIGDHTWSRFLVALQHRLPDASFGLASPLMSRLRIRKEPAEIDLLRRAAHATDRVLAHLASIAMSGQTERQLARRVADRTLETGHEAAAFTIVASGPNGASPHHEPTDRTIEEGHMVVIDFGGTIGGYHSDVTRTFSVGPPTTEQTEVHEVVRQATQAAHARAGPGVVGADIDDAARRVISDAGYGEYFIHRTGHGIGLDGHEEPYIIETNLDPVEEGMAFSIEPGIYIPNRFGVRIEDIVVVTATGIEPLNQAERRLLEVS